MHMLAKVSSLGCVSDWLANTHAPWDCKGTPQVFFYIKLLK